MRKLPRVFKTQYRWNSNFKEPILKVVNDRNFRVAIIGRPNTGKSSLYNKLVGGYLAIVDNQPGVTIDCQEDQARLEDMDFTCIDTPGAENIDIILEQTREAIKSADVALVVTDYKVGTTQWDKRIAKFVLEKKVPAIHILNKVDEVMYEDEQDEIFERHSIGIGRPITMSAEMKIGFAELYACLLPLYIGHVLKFSKIVQENKEKFSDEKEIRLSIIGRTNVGKSTMFNRLLGKERVMVSDIPGTTRDTIQIKCLYKDRPILLADTAGMRKDKYLTNKIEKESHKDTLRTIQYSNVVILVVDAQQPLTNDDLQIARMTEEEGRCLVIAANKWDLVQSPYEIANKIEEKVTSSLAQVKGVKVVVCSALKGKNVELLVQTAVDAYDKWNTRITTGQLNRFLAKFMKTLTFQPSELPKIQYMTQIESRPPTFALWFTRASDLPKPFERQLVNALREEYGLDGVPFRLIHKRKQGYEEYQKGKKEHIEAEGIEKNEEAKRLKDENRKKVGLPPKHPTLGKRKSKRFVEKPKKRVSKKSRRYKFLSH